MTWIPFRSVAVPAAIVLITLSLLVLLRGHHEPGGGFIGGLLAAAGFGVHGLAFGPSAGLRRLRIHPLRLAGFGLLLAAASGLVGLVQGGPFMDPWWGGEVPAVGKIGTPLLFDVGVYLVVVGGVTTILIEALRLADRENGPAPGGRS